MCDVGFFFLLHKLYSCSLYVAREEKLPDVGDGVSRSRARLGSCQLADTVARDRELCLQDTTLQRDGIGDRVRGRASASALRSHGPWSWA